MRRKDKQRLRLLFDNFQFIVNSKIRQQQEWAMAVKVDEKRVKKEYFFVLKEQLKEMIGKRQRESRKVKMAKMRLGQKVKARIVGVLKKYRKEAVTSRNKVEKVQRIVRYHMKTNYFQLLNQYRILKLDTKNKT